MKAKTCAQGKMIRRIRIQSRKKYDMGSESDAKENQLNQSWK